jgi:hypothetical protein
VGTTATKAKQQTDDANLQAGLQANQSTLPSSWNVVGTTYTLVQILAILASRLAKAAAAASAKAKYMALVQAADEEVASTKPVVDAVRKQLRIWCNNVPDALAAYGMTVTKAGGPKSPVTKVLAAAKGKSTRTARGTKGRVQKSYIVGAVPAAVTITTATEHVAPLAAPEPSASSPTAPTSTTK